MEKLKFKTKCPFNIQQKTGGESIEEMLRRLTADKQPIPDNVPPIYTAEAEGVIPDYDIRADRFDVAMQAQDKFSRSNIAKGTDKATLPTEEEKDKEKEQTE